MSDLPDNRDEGEPPTGRISRRAFIKAAGAAGVVAGLAPILAACGGDGEEAAPPPAEPAPAEPAPPAETGAAPPAAGETGRPVKIGLVSPQTGPLAAFGETDSYMVGQMQQILADGIEIGGVVHPVEIDLKDTQSDPTRAAEVTQEAIDGGVDLVIPGATPETTNPVGDTCEANGVPCLSSVCPWQPWFFRTTPPTPENVGSLLENDTFEWQYHFFWGLEDIIAIFLDMWSQIETNQVVGVIYPNDGDGNAWGGPLGFPPPLADAGYTVVDPGRFETGTDDFSAQIAQFKSEGVEIVTGVPVPPDFTTFWTQSAQQDFHPKIATVGKALLFPASVDALPEGLGEGLSTEVWWHPTFPVASSLTGETSQELADAWTTATGKQWTMPLGWSHAIFEVAVDSLKRTVDIDDPAAVRDAIAATNLDTMTGHVQWGSGPTKNVAKSPVVGGQWVTGSGDYAYDLTVVSNVQYPDTPTTAALQAIPGS
jgi:branched-chain amino acid transport system substrate-binding protein